MPHQTPYIGFEKDARGVRGLWERFNAGLIDTSERRNTYQQLLLSEWQRCTALGVDVAMTVARRLSEDEFRQRTQANQLLLETSIPIIKDVGRFLDEVPGLMILTEHTGCVLHITGDRRVRDHAAARSGIAEGSKWDEASAGTNGMGTALSTRQPVHVYATEHFCEGWQSWTCAAAPIFDIDGRSVLGIIDFTTPESDFRDQALALTVSLANSIQARMTLHRELERGRVVNAFTEAARQYPHDDMLALDHAGRVVMHSPNEHCRHVAQNWAAGGFDGAAVRETIDVTAPDSGTRVGTIVLLSSRPAGSERVVGSVGRTPFPVKRFGEFLTCDPDTTRMLDELQRVAAADVNVLITGETGTGKELLARHLHACSPRRAEPYLAINCGAISAELMESTFFGYVRGAFSGADPRGRAGYFESARGGTLFLDEVGELPPAMQTSLLRVLEDGSYQRVGSSETLRARCRVVAATHRNLEQLVAQRQFREDLYFRLKVIHKSVKPLRERRCDVPLIVEQFVVAMRRKHGLAAAEITKEAHAALARYRWPGNAREVRNVVEAAVLCSDGPLGIDCLPPEVLRQPGETNVRRQEPEFEADPSAGRDYERQLIVGMLRKYRKVNHAARAMGIARSTLYRKFAELEIDPAQFTSGTVE
jgi:sigma-54 dependent transcriptional regulator, acetoin dehydrogenase operon transcriptional activator AcoR